MDATDYTSVYTLSVSPNVEPEHFPKRECEDRTHFLCRHGPHDKGTRFLFRTTRYWASGEWPPALEDVVEGGVGVMIIKDILSANARHGGKGMALTPERCIFTQHAKVGPI